MRAALIPAVAVPLSLVGGIFLMLLMGFSINLLTLLAMVLAIGLVVDDAIIVVENVHRHIEQGKTPLQAALTGARELAMPIIAMTTTLVAVYAPIGFMGGLVGTLFTEFAFALAGAVLISGVVALTLSPMLSSRVLKSSSGEGRFERAVERFFNGLAKRYSAALRSSLETLPVTLVFAAVVLASIYFMFTTSQNELAPDEDQSILFFQATAPQTATIDYNEAYIRQVVSLFESVPEYDKSFILAGFGGDVSTTFGGFKMPQPSERERSQMEIMPEVQEGLGQIAGLQVAAFPRPSLPGSGGGLPLQFVITSAAGYQRLDDLQVDGFLEQGVQALADHLEGIPGQARRVGQKREGRLAVPEEVDQLQLPEPVDVVGHPRRVRNPVEVQEVGELLPDRIRVRGGQFLGQELALRGLSRGVPDEPGPAPDEGDGRVARPLEVDQTHDGREAAHVEARGRGVEADVAGPGLGGEGSPSPSDGGAPSPSS